MSLTRLSPEETENLVRNSPEFPCRDFLLALSVGLSLWVALAAATAALSLMSIL